MKRLAEELHFTTDEELEDLFNKTAWHFDRKYGRKGASYDIFKQAVTYVNDFNGYIVINIVKESRSIG